MLSIEVARQLGYDVQPFIGTWGDGPTPSTCWQLRDVAWPATTQAAQGRRFPTAEAALAEAAARVAYRLGVTVEELHHHLGLVLATTR